MSRLAINPYRMLSHELTDERDTGVPLEQLKSMERVVVRRIPLAGALYDETRNNR
jgi:hypothetical protein